MIQCKEKKHQREGRWGSRFAGDTHRESEWVGSCLPNNPKERVENLCSAWQVRTQSDAVPWQDSTGCGKGTGS